MRDPVNLTHPVTGHEMTVDRRAFERVWKACGWKEVGAAPGKKPKREETPEPVPEENPPSGDDEGKEGDRATPPFPITDA